MEGFKRLWTAVGVCGQLGTVVGVCGRLGMVVGDCNPLPPCPTNNFILKKRECSLDTRSGARDNIVKRR